MELNEQNIKAALTKVVEPDLKKDIVELNLVTDIVRKNAKYTILGNHDAAVAGRMDYSYYYDAAREALDYHRRILSDENMEWLRNLSYIERDEGQMIHRAFLLSVNKKINLS